MPLPVLILPPGNPAFTVDISLGKSKREKKDVGVYLTGPEAGQAD
jgi:hypothetical protein